MSRRKLLLADDSVTIQKVVNLTFADEGIEVFSVSDGIEAVDRLMEISPDLVMADVNMPGINGYQVCERIKQHEKFKNTPVILLVGSFEPFDEQESRRVGADGYLTKPFQSIRQLVSKVSDLLERAPENAELSSSAATAAGGFAESQDFSPAQEAPSVIEPEEVYESSSESTRYEDDGYDDDEMIQSNQATSFPFDEAQKFSSRNYVEDREEDYLKTQPLSPSDWQDIESASQSTADENYASSNSSSTTAQNETYSGATSAQSEPSASFFDAETTAESDEEDDDFLELFDDDEFEEDEDDEAENFQPAQVGTSGEISAENQTNVDSQSETYQTAEETENYRAAEYVQPVESEDAQPVEVQTAESSTEQQEFQSSENIYSTGEITESVQPEQQSEIGQSYEAQSAPVSDDTQNQAAVVNASSQQFSPELIDAIAQRVIEKLSDRAVKEIAWEVVPQQADVIIKKMVEEKLKE